MVEIREHHMVPVGDDQQVAWRDGSVIEEGRDSIVAIDNAGRRPPGGDVAENALSHAYPLRRRFHLDC
jgi:hypothetical protein